MSPAAVENRDELKVSKITMESMESTDTLSDEDQRLKDELEMLVERLSQPNPEMYLPALEAIRQIIKSSTTSITSVPKPLKYMVPHYEQMKQVYNKLHDKKTKQSCADIISVLAMTMGGPNESVFYRFNGDPSVNVSDWGHEYVRHLASEITALWPHKTNDYQERLMTLVEQIISFTMAHNAEAEACDLLMEVDQLGILGDFIDRDSYPKVALYLQHCVPFVPEPENELIFRVIVEIALKFGKYYDAARVVLMLGDSQKLKTILQNCTDNLVKLQIAILIGRQRLSVELDDPSDNWEDQKMTELLTNSRLNTYFMILARELDIMEGKTPEDVYKSHLEPNRLSTGRTYADSARNNLAASFVNGMINAGFGVDKIFLDFGNKWLYKNKDHGIISATASIGLLRLWDIDGGLTSIDQYLYSEDDYVKSGSLLACGILNCGIRDEVEPAHALLADYLNSSNILLKICSILGIGIAYAGSNSPLALSSLRSLFPTENDEVVGALSISMGLIAAGSANSEDTELLFHEVVTCSMDKNFNSHTRFLYLALGLLYIGKQSACETLLESLKVLEDPNHLYIKIIMEMCAYAGTGNVLKVQEMLHICSEHSEMKTKTETTDADKSESKSRDITLSDIQSVAVIGVALISMGEEIGSEMAFRSFGHLMRYGEPCIRKSVPLAIALSSISNPKMAVLEMLNKFSHDNDPEVANAAIFALGLVGAGTNNARLALLLRNLAQYYAKDPSNLFLVRIAQGLTHLGKGTMTLSPYHSNKQIMKTVSVAAILCVLFTAMDMKNLIFGSCHYLLYTIVPAIEPRCLMTFDEQLNHLPVPVRVGIAVDTVAQAGKPKTITGFQTNTTPVLLSPGERAELATEEYIPVTNHLEGFVILRKNPAYKQ